MVYSLAVQSAVSLLVAHLIGDFLVQTEKDVAQKTRLPILLKHAAILAALSYALTGIWRCWEIPAVIFLAHLVFDYVKSRFTSNGALSIAIDQVAHLLTIAFWQQFYFRCAGLMSSPFGRLFSARDICKP
jgi:hypothetical protein